MERRCLRSAICGALLAACAAAHCAADGYESVAITNIPHVSQQPDFCGEACAEMVFRSLGAAITQEDVFDIAGVPPELGRGCYTPELVAALRKTGIDTGPAWYRLRADHADADVEEQWRALHADLKKQLPSIVCMTTGEAPGGEHIRLVVGYRAARDEVVYHEPAGAGGAFSAMPRSQFLKRWPLRPASGPPFVIRIRCQPEKPVPYKRPPGFTRAAYAQHVRKLRTLLPKEGFTIVVEPPFVVIGDEPPAAVRGRAANTVAWAVARMKQDYFKRDPEKILNVWLFKDKESYEKNSRDMLGEDPTTPFGFCSATTGDLIMNIATGGGTLVHEIVHPFMHANFPECPSWFNEGMGSLYEQASERDGHIIGLTNWRLAGLQKAIRDRDVISFEKLASTTSTQFYNMDRGTNYAQARYLCYYLQEKGLLARFYREFRANRKDDPTGYNTLKKVLDEKDMTAFKKRWEEFVLKLRYP